MSTARSHLDRAHLRIAGRTLAVTISHLEAKPDTRDFSSLVHAACDATGLKQKIFMTALRHALTAMKVLPFLPPLLSTFLLNLVLCLRLVRRSLRRSMYSGKNELSSDSRTLSSQMVTQFDTRPNCSNTHTCDYNTRTQKILIAQPSGNTWTQSWFACTR